MDTKELLAALAEAGAEPYYRVRAYNPSGFPHDGTPYVDQLPDGRWAVGIFERGIDRPIHYFDTEDAACRHFYNWLTRPRKKPSERTPEEIAADEELMQQWRARRAQADREKSE